MNQLDFIYTIPFQNAWDRLGYTAQDQTDLETYISSFFENHPDNSHGKVFPGEIIQETGGAYKLRFSPAESNAGKSGSTRIIYCVITSYKLAFLDVYPKNQRASLSKKEKTAISKLIKLLKVKER